MLRQHHSKENQRITMSKKLTTGTTFTEIDLIREALEQQGFSPVFDSAYTPQTMRAFAGTSFRANVGVTSENFTEVTGLHTYGDLGFAVKANGKIDLIGDDLLIATPRFTPILDGITSAYAERKYIRNHYEAGFTLDSRHVTGNGDVALTFVQRGTR
jgi:hypothetical protein